MNLYRIPIFHSASIMPILLQWEWCHLPLLQRLQQMLPHLVLIKQAVSRLFSICKRCGKGNFVKRLQSAAGRTIGSRGGTRYSHEIWSGGTNYSAMDRRGGLLSRGDCPRRDMTTPCGFSVIWHSCRHPSDIQIHHCIWRALSAHDPRQYIKQKTIGWEGLGMRQPSLQHCDWDKFHDPITTHIALSTSGHPMVVSCQSHRVPERSHGQHLGSHRWSLWPHLCVQHLHEWPSVHCTCESVTWGVHYMEIYTGISSLG